MRGADDARSSSQSWAIILVALAILVASLAALYLLLTMGTCPGHG